MFLIARGCCFDEDVQVALRHNLFGWDKVEDALHMADYRIYKALP